MIFGLITGGSTTGPGFPDTQFPATRRGGLSDEGTLDVVELVELVESVVDGGAVVVVEVEAGSNVVAAVVVVATAEGDAGIGTTSTIGTTSGLTAALSGTGLFVLARFPRVGASAPTSTGSPETPDDPETDTAALTKPAGIPPSVFASGSNPPTRRAACSAERALPRDNSSVFPNQSGIGVRGTETGIPAKDSGLPTSNGGRFAAVPLSGTEFVSAPARFPPKRRGKPNQAPFGDDTNPVTTNETTSKTMENRCRRITIQTFLLQTRHGNASQPKLPGHLPNMPPKTVSVPKTWEKYSGGPLRMGEFDQAQGFRFG